MTRTARLFLIAVFVLGTALCALLVGIRATRLWTGPNHQLFLQQRQTKLVQHRQRPRRSTCPPDQRLSLRPGQHLGLSTTAASGSTTAVAPTSQLAAGGHPQPGPGQGTIRCSSDNGKRNWCNIGNARDARLVNQVSGSPCVRDSTWGIDNRGLWVDNGCRADFAFGGGGGYYPQPGGPGQGTIRCSSDNGKRNWCNIGNARDAQLVNQVSGSPCVRGSTWGIDNRGLWVDNGCRADFAIGGSYRPPPSQPLIITCSSNDGKRNWCDIGGRRDIRLNRQISGSACIEGQTWGIDNRGHLGRSRLPRRIQRPLSQSTTEPLPTEVAPSFFKPPQTVGEKSVSVINVMSCFSTNAPFASDSAFSFTHSGSFANFAQLSVAAARLLCRSI